MASAAAAAAQCFSHSSSPATWALRQRGGGAGAGVLRLSSRRTFSVSAAAVFDNQNREWVPCFSFDPLKQRSAVQKVKRNAHGWLVGGSPDCRYVIVGGGNAAGYAARTFVEHGMADGRLCIVSKEVLLLALFQ